MADDFGVELPEDKTPDLEAAGVWRERRGMDRSRSRRARERDRQGSQLCRDLEQKESFENYEQERERRIYRKRTILMLRKYMQYSIETGRLPSVLGREFFRAKVTTYTVATFEDRVIFVHDMETCLDRLDEFSR